MSEYRSQAKLIIDNLYHFQMRRYPDYELISMSFGVFSNNRGEEKANYRLSIIH